MAQITDKAVEGAHDASDLIITLRLKLLREISLLAGDLTKGDGQSGKRVQNMSDHNIGGANKDKHGQNDNHKFNSLGDGYLCLTGLVIRRNELVHLSHVGGHTVGKCPVCRILIRRRFRSQNRKHLISVVLPQRPNRLELCRNGGISGGTNARIRIPLGKPRKDAVIFLDLRMHRLPDEHLLLPFCRHKARREP